MKKQKSKALIAAVLLLIMVVSVAISRVSADPVQTYTITIQADNGYTISANPDPQSGVNRPGEFIVNENQYSGFKSGNNFIGTVTTQDGKILIEIPVGTTVVPSFNNGAFSLKNGDVYVQNNTEINGNMTLTVSAPQQNQPQNPPQEPQGGEDDISINADFTGTYMNASINNLSFMDDADGVFKDKFNGVVREAGTNDQTETNTFKFQNVFGEAPIIKCTINGVEYEEGDDGVVVEKPDAKTAIFTVTVPGAEAYTITGVPDPNFKKPRTIIWTNPNYVPRDAEDAEWIKEFKLENGYGYITAVYDENGNLLDPQTYTGADWVFNENGGGVGSNGFGWVSLYKDYKVVFEFVPDYGYQLTDIRINGQKLGVTGLMNTYEFIMPDTNIHFDAEFTQVDDVVKAEGTTVESGRITLPNGEIERGTAQLKVNDVELSEDKIKGFTNAAGDFNVKTYLDIDLYQVFYKGKDDSDDVWSNKIDELEQEATISIKLADGLTADDIVIVHNVHDGDEYEVIEIESYDEATNSVTFKTKSFSNYAIATKGDGSSKKSSNPRTGDKFIIYGAVLAVAVGVLVFAVVAKKKSKKD